jgi:hypothetical protein
MELFTTISLFCIWVVLLQQAVYRSSQQHFLKIAPLSANQIWEILSCILLVFIVWLNSSAIWKNMHEWVFQRLSKLHESERQTLKKSRVYAFFKLHEKPYTITNFLLTKREVCTEKYRTEVFFVQTEPIGRGCTKRLRSDISLHVHTEVNKKFVFWHLYLKQTRNAWFDMHISRLVHIWSKKTTYTMYSTFFSTKNYSQISY